MRYAIILNEEHNNIIKDVSALLIVFFLSHTRARVIRTNIVFVQNRFYAVF